MNKIPMKKITRIPDDLADIPNLPPTVSITSARTGICTDDDVSRRTLVLMLKVKAGQPINEFNRIWTHVPSSQLIQSGYLPSEKDHNVWIRKSEDGKSERPLAVKTSDG